MLIFYVKQAVDLSGKDFYQEGMVLMPCTVMNSTMRYFQFRYKTFFVSDINVLRQKQFQSRRASCAVQTCFLARSVRT